MAFPARLAAIDIGSNAIRFVVADFKSTTSYTVVEQLRLPVRLGRAVFDSGYIPDPVIEAAVQALRTIATIAHDLSIDGMRAVATSAVRDSSNRDEIVRRAREEAGIELTVIDGDEEARLVYLAARHRLQIEDGRYLMVDIGGGSMEIAAVDAKRMLHIESHPVGALRFAAKASATRDDVDAMRHAISNFSAQLEASPVFAEPIKAMIAIGGSIDALARIAGVRPDKRGVLILERADLQHVIGELAELDYEARVARFKLPSDRADVILPAAMLYECMAALSNAESIAAPQVGVKEGVLLDLAADIESAVS